MLDDSLTFRDLIVRVAEQVGVHSAPVNPGDVAGPPTDAYELDRVKRAINDGMEEMARDYPKWRILRPVVEVSLPATPGPATIGGDVGRVRLDTSFLLIPLHEWTWRLTGSTGYGGSLSMVPMGRILGMAAYNTAQLGSPAFAAIGPVPAADSPAGQRRAIELRVWPKPNQDYTLQGVARVQIPRMSEDGERSPFGSQHDRTVLDAALWVLHKNNPDIQMRQYYKGEYESSLAKSKAIDGELAASSVGVGVDGAMRRDVPVRGEINFTASTYNGAALN